MVTTHRSEESIFAEALDRPLEARAAFLDAVCGGDAALQARVEQLLKSHTAAGSFLQFAPPTTDEPLAERPGTIVGAYKLLQQIGEGGMGVVYMAEQEHPVRRRVALKIIKPGMDSRQVIARFEAERQALAMMDHQNIAKVLDAGATESGRPYFVMELVHGVPITKFCDDNRLTLRQRLELFVPICHAIQHAHHKGVIHRDIKPTNILVTMYDDRPVPKVIDFGVAKAVEQRLTEKTLFTQYGMLVGTFEYMSPEQAEMNAFGVDTRSDVYSLGVLLYELLTGTTPLEKQRLRAAALVELVQLIKEEEPPRPSERLSSSGTLPKFAAACRTEPQQLSQLLRGELDWIVMKCLEKDRARRYETANGLARDVERFLKDEPVEACPPSLAYRGSKFLRKHRTAALATAGILIASVLATIGQSVNVIRARRAERAAAEANEAAQLERDRALAAERAAVLAKEQADSAARRLKTATEIATDGIEYYTRRNWFAAHEHFTRAIEVEPGLNTPYIYRGSMFAQLGMWDQAAQDYDRRFQLANRANAETWFDYLLLKVYRGDEAGYREACEEMLRQHKNTADLKSRHSVVSACLLAAPPVGDPKELCEMAESIVAAGNVPWYLSCAGRAHLLAGNFPKAEARCREAIKLSTGSPKGMFRLNYVTLALALHEQGKTGEAKEALRVADQAKNEWTAMMQDGPVDTMPFGWGNWLEFILHHRQATVRITGSPPADDPRLAKLYDRSLATIRYGDVNTVMDTGRQQVRRQAWDEAASSFAQVLDKLPPGFRDSSRDFRDSSREMQSCVEMVQRPEVFDRLVTLRPNSRRVLWHARGRNYASSGEWAKAASDYEKALGLLNPSLTSTGAETGPWIGWGAMTFELGALLLLAEDRAGYQRVCDSVVEKSGIPEDPLAFSLVSRACTMMPDAVDDVSRPVQWARYAVQEWPRIAWFQYALGIAQHRAGEHEEAIQSLKQSLAVDEGWVGRGQNFAVLALAHHSLKRDDEARQWLNRGRSWLQATNRDAAGWKFGYAASDYLGDWLCAQVLLREAESLLTVDHGR